MRFVRRFYFVVTALLGGCSEQGDVSHANHPSDIILITVDTLRPDHLGLYGYERATSINLDRWFADGVIYNRSYSTNAATSQSVASLLSGLLPADHGVRMHYQLLADDVPLILKFLPSDYQTAAFISNMVLTDEAIGWGHRFDHYDDFVDQQEPYRKVYERDATRTTDAALIWLIEHRDPKRPLFLWVHYIDPHGPYRPPATWPRRFTHAEPVEIDLSRILPYQRESGVTDGLAYIDAYDEEIAYTDDQIGRLLDAYARMYPIDNALLVFTSDHGESMMEHELWFTHSYHIYDEIVRVPLMLRGPGVVPGRRDELVSGIDVAPTLLRHAGVTVPSTMSKVNLTTGEGLGPDRVLIVEARGFEHHHGAVRDSHKWVRTVDPDRLQVVSRTFFDLSVDAKELERLEWPTDTETSRLLEDLCANDPDPAGVPHAMRKGQQLKVPKISPRASLKALQKLRSLGYVQ